MAANLLKSKRAIEISVAIVRTFVRLRELLSSHTELTKELNKIKEFSLKHSHESDREFRRVWQAIEKLSKPSPQNESKPRIGFDLSQ